MNGRHTRLPASQTRGITLAEGHERRFLSAAALIQLSRWIALRCWRKRCATSYSRRGRLRKKWHYERTRARKRTLGLWTRRGRKPVAGRRRWLSIACFFSKFARSVLRHIRVTSKHELKQRIMAGIDDVNRHPVIHTWSYKLAEAA